MSIYQRIYSTLVESRKSLKENYKPGSGLEKHHIIPKHAGGTDDESNFSYLTIREHRIAHWLLWKIYRRKGDLFAWNCMSNKCRYHAIGWRHSKETLEKMSKTRTGKTISKEARTKISNRLKGRKLSSSHKEKISKSLKISKSSNRTTF